MRPLLKNILFIDVETVGSSPNYDQLSIKYKKHWEKKCSALKLRNANFTETTAELYNSKAAIYAEFGKIVCISTAFFNQNQGKPQLRIKSFYGNNERKLLLVFFDLLNNFFNDKNRHFLCGHNIREFDLPYICRRALIQGINLPRILNLQSKKPWELKHVIDTMEQWRFGDYKNFTSLDLLTTLFNIESPKSTLDGSKVHSAYWEEGLLESIKDYCELDVIATSKVYLNLSSNREFEYELIYSTENYDSEEE